MRPGTVRASRVDKNVIARLTCDIAEEMLGQYGSAAERRLQIKTEITRLEAMEWTAR
jgi:hypothetical protein